MARYMPRMPSKPVLLPIDLYDQIEAAATAAGLTIGEWFRAACITSLAGDRCQHVQTERFMDRPRRPLTGGGEDGED